MLNEWIKSVKEYYSVDRGEENMEAYYSNMSYFDYRNINYFVYKDNCQILK